MTEKRKILEIMAGFSIEKPLGGIERFVMELSRSLDHEKYEITIFGLWDFGTPYRSHWIELLNSENIQTAEGVQWDGQHPYQSFWRTWKVLKRYTAAHKFDGIHSHDQFGNMMAVMLKFQQKRATLIRTLHNHQEAYTKRFRRLLFRDLIYPMAYDVEIGLNEQMVADLNSRWITRLLRKPARLIRNAINLARFQNGPMDGRQVRKALGIALDAKVVGSIGRFTQQKGYADLLDAAAIVLKSDASIYFVLVGSGELEDDLNAQAQQLGIQNRVIFTGPRSDIEKVIQSFDLFVCSSLWEGFSTVILESMAAGVPVLATNIPGNSDLIDSGVNGLLYAPRSPKVLSEEIVQALQNPLELKNLADQAKESVKKFTIEEIALQYEKLFDAL